MYSTIGVSFIAVAQMESRRISRILRRSTGLPLPSRSSTGDEDEGSLGGRRQLYMCCCKVFRGQVVWGQDKM